MLFNIDVLIHKFLLLTYNSTVFMYTKYIYTKIDDSNYSRINHSVERVSHYLEPVK